MVRLRDARYRAPASSRSASIWGQAHRGEILRAAAALVEAGKLNPPLNERRFQPSDLADAYALVESGALGKMVIEL
jgi:NADPH:quinone reductase